MLTKVELNIYVLSRKLDIQGSAQVHPEIINDLWTEAIFSLPATTLVNQGLEVANRLAAELANYLHTSLWTP